MANQTFEEIFGPEARRQRLLALAGWMEDHENEHRLGLYLKQHESYVLMFQKYGDNPDVMSKVLKPQLPSAVSAYVDEHGVIELRESGVPLIDPPLELPAYKPLPEGQIIFGRDLTEDGYPGWYAASDKTGSTTVAVGTVAQGPDGNNYVLTRVGPWSKYWVLKNA